MRRFGGKDDRHEDLVRSILDRTSGPACGRALEHLPGLVDNILDSGDRTLVQAHLENCPGCRSVAVVLGWMGKELPAMAEIDPGEEFTAAVLVRTARLPSRAAAAGQLTGAAGLVDRLGNWWEERIQRPLFAWQVAYALTVLLTVLTVAPGSPLHGVPRQILTSVQAGPTRLSALGGAFAIVDQGVAQGAGFLKETVWDGIRSDVGLRLQSTDQARDDLGRDVEGAWSEIRHKRTGPALMRLSAAGSDIKEIWRLWWRSNSINQSSTAERR